MGIYKSITIKAIKQVGKFKLSKGDTVFIYRNKEWFDITKIKGFSALGLYTSTRGPFPFCAGLFYGVGYESDGTRFLYLKEMRDYKKAVLCEWLRLKIPYRLGKILFKI